MVETVFIEVERCRFWVPAWLAPVWPHQVPLARFPSFCGAGSGWGDRLVPDTIWFLRIAPCCFIHDLDWLTCAATEVDFHLANVRFRHNLLELIRERSRWLVVRLLRERRALSYYQAVETAGRRFFAPGFDGDAEACAEPLAHPAVMATFARLGVSCSGSN